MPDDEPGPDAPSAAPSRRVTRRRVLGYMVGGVAVAGASVALGPYHRQTISYLSHWKGGPGDVVAWVPHVPAPALRIAVAGDIGDSGDRLEASARRMSALAADQPYDVLLLLGDNVYPDGDPERLDETVWRPFGPVLASGTELLAILGNHDVRDDHGDAQMAALGMPGRYWSREIDDVVVVGLDSNDLGDDQLAFLDDKLAASAATWKIVAVHHPPYSAGYQGSAVDVRQALAPIVSRRGVHLVLSGHDHDYQRSTVVDGVTYVVSGACSGTRRTGDDAFTAASFSWHHVLDLAVYPDRLVGRAVGQNGMVADEFVIGAG